MKKILLTLACTVFAVLSLRVANAQCASSAYISNGGNCISLVWMPAGNLPGTLPPSVTYNGNIYDFANGLGDVPFPAIYKLTSVACALPSEVINGNITINYTGAEITCKYPDGTLLALGDINLQVRRSGSANIIDWTTAGTDISSVEIQRSNNARDFVTVKKFTLSNSQSAANRGSYAEAAISGISYYRVKATAVNNRVSFSKIVQISDASTQVALVSPNPAHGNFVLSGVNVTNPAQVSIVDGTGRKLNFKVLRFDATSKTMQIAVDKNVTGMIFINCNNSERQVLKALLQ